MANKKNGVAPAVQELNQVFGEGLVEEEAPVDEGGVGFDSDDDIPGLSSVPMGERVSAFPIMRFRGHTGITNRVGVLVKKAGTALVHYVEGMRPFHCFGGVCCKRLKFPPLRYIIPVVVYDTNNVGKLVSKKFEIQYLSLGQERYAYFVNYINAGGQPHNKDFVVTCSDDKYQKLIFSEAPGEALWRKYPELHAEVVKAWENKRGFLRDAIASTITEQDFLEMFGGAAPGTGAVGDDPFAGMPLDDALNM